MYFHKKCLILLFLNILETSVIADTIFSPVLQLSYSKQNMYLYLKKIEVHSLYVRIFLLMNTQKQIFNIYNNIQKSIQFRHCQTLSLQLLEVVCRGMTTRMARIQWIECGGSLISGQIWLIKDSVGLESGIPPAYNNCRCLKKMIWILMIK